MQETSYKRIRYRRGEDRTVFSELQRGKSLYLAITRKTQNGNAALLFKGAVFIVLIVTGYRALLHAQDLFQCLLSYLWFGGACALAGINFGHDAAHRCVTGDRRFDRLILEFTFMLQGLNAYLWRLRHNHSHHPHPNVREYDSDLELTQLIYLGQPGRRRSYHRLQFLYAPLLYMCVSLAWIFIIDFRIYFRKDLANLKDIRHSYTELFKMILFKILYLFLFIGIPALATGLHATVIVAGFVLMHLVLSLLVALVFFVSHHTMETAYAEVRDGQVDASWFRQQVASTLDFHGESKFAAFLFGGFSAHLAHHFFPGVSHVHYPALTRLMRKTLRKHDIRYNDPGLLPAIISHFRLLRALPQKH